MTSNLISDYLTGVEIDITHKPEEIVRQEYLRVLHEEFGYPKEHMATEVSIYSGSSEVSDVITGSPKRADIVIYQNAAQDYDEIYVVVECKHTESNTGEAQAKSYGNATTASIVIWHNGPSTLIWERQKPTKYGYKRRLHLPRFGEYYGDKKILKSQLRPAVNLQGRFRRIHDNIYANAQSSDKTWVFNQMLYLLFIKMYDEKLFDPECKFIISDTEEKEVIEKGRSDSFHKRIWGLFEEVKTSAGFSDVFSGKEEIELPVEQVAYIVSELEYLHILYTDVKGEAFQAFINDYFRGEAGQFFTPDPIKRLVVDILAPQPNKDVVLDPACGSGGFLVATIEYFRKLIKRKEGFVDENGEPLPDSALQDRDRKLIAGEIKAIAGKNVLGTDFDRNLTKIAKMYMVMVDDGHSGIFTTNALIGLGELKASTGRIHEGCATVIMTNPPFGSKGKVSRKDILENFDLGYKWRKGKKAGEYVRLEKTEKNLIGGHKKGDGQIPDILFMERCYELLKPGGRIAVVLPDGDLSNQSLEYFRYWLASHFLVLGVISLPPHTFVPFGAGPKSSILVCVKPKSEKSIPTDYAIFFAKLTKIGYDVRGNTIYKRDSSGLVVDNSGLPISQDVESIQKRGAVDSDIPHVLNEWRTFAKAHPLIGW